MLSNKLYFRLLILFVALLAVAQMGWGIYFLTPTRQKEKPRPKYLAIRGYFSPTFKYKYCVQSADGLQLDWREMDVPEDIGRKILNLLRGSKSMALVEEEYIRQNAWRRRNWRPYTSSVSVLHVFENGSDQPSLKINFQDSLEFIVTRAGGDADFFMIPAEKRVELDDLTAAIQWGPILKDE